MHHAYLYNDESTLPDFSGIDSADLIYVTYSKLPIDAVREFTRRVYIEPVGESGLRVAAVVTNSINAEAQNALLKLLEEPPLHTTFHFVVTDQSRLLPTLLSRFEVVAANTTIDTTIATRFLKQSYAERLEEVANRTKEKDVSWQATLLSGLEKLASEKKIERGAARVILFVAGSISGPGASAKMLLEHLALELP